MQAVTHIAPATALLFTIQLTTSQAGIAAPLAYLLAFLIVGILGISLSQLAKHLPSAGGYYTYVSRTVHPRIGFLTAWLYFLYDPTVAGFCLAYIGSVLETVLRVEYHLIFPWWLFLFAAGSLVAFTSYRGIELSARMLILFGTTEIIAVLILSLSGFFRPGNGGLNLSSFNPANALSTNGLYLAVVFSIFALSGWEGVAPLAEESKNPRRNLPKAILSSILFMGIFLVVCSWGLILRWGTSNVQSFLHSPVNPTFVLARQSWGRAWVVIILALLNSMIAVAVAGNNGATRVWFAMSRSGALPKQLSAIHPRYKTPTNAVKLQILVMFAIGLGLGYLIGPENEFEFMGTVLTFALIFIYSAGNLGVFLYYSRVRKNEFNLILHAVFPLLGTIALLFVGRNSLNPWPDPPTAYAPWVVAVWLVVGVLVLIVMKVMGKEEWMAKAGRIMGERAETEQISGLELISKDSHDQT